ncbi:chemotaxis protein CheA [Thalassotalea euphylliae]|uniref:Chemotaxis protein CheA n=1 Tax=Thalassotalea euphylliae TaxID=1655234 RepID=A0A3E0TQG1_9GAMM|nr:chemotaxis protein CheA [Thalassotalea euphylliae]REL26580.1 chemotaxis protein CheA [Thalassotalea euphylliae]
MSLDLSQFIPTFLEESFEGLELMESSLLNLEQGDDETINSIFRAAHSIKGGAGTFGFGHVTDFTHLVETLLDEMRDGRREINNEEVEVLLASVDCMRLMIEAIQNDDDYDPTSIEETSERLSFLLASSSDGSGQGSALDNEPMLLGKIWQITFIPEHHLVQTGNDPLLLFNALEDLGELIVLAKTEQLPSLTEIDVEELYIHWQLTLMSEDATEADIREVFEWVEDECQLDIHLLSDDTPSTPPEQADSPEQIESPEQANSPEQLDSLEQTNSPEQAEAATNNELDQANAASEQASAPVTAPVTAPTVAPATVNEKPAKAAESKATAKPAAKGKGDAGSIRVGVDKVDSLINLVGELVITQSMLSELGNDFDLSKVEKLTAGLEQLLQNTKELQESVMRIRMLPISFAFNRFPRLIHDLAKKTGKDIELIINGENTELDKTVMEQIGDPLVHLVRNAVDHGIEPAEKRLAAGKSEQGTIWLDAYHQGGSIVIEIKDNGGGINREAVFNKALEKGLIDANASLSDQQVFDLIFEPGFSTAKAVSDISGRGVGMDVVKKNIQALGGRIQVDSVPGEGSTFKVYLPLTLAILDGQLVKVGDEVFVIPLITIVESLQIKQEQINRVSGDMVLYRLREDNVPVIPIFELFNLPAAHQAVENALMVVVEADGQKVGLMVDDLLAQQQVVIKSLKDNYQDVSGISGATILGDGSVAMILDIPGIITMAQKIAADKQAERIARYSQGLEGAIS